MKLTNKTRLPQAVYHWLVEFNLQNEINRNESIVKFREEYSDTESFYFSDDLSATTMIKSPQEIILTKRHYNEIERDASELYDAIIGTAVHQSFEKMTMRPGEQREIRVGLPIKDVLIHAQFDSIYQNELSDYKTMKIGSFLFGDKEYEFTAQLSICKFLYEVTHPDETLNPVGKIICLFTDWRDAEYQKKMYGFGKVENYPIRSVEIPITMWNNKETERWIIRKITDFKIALLEDDNNLPPCTDKERWLSETKKGGKKYRKCEKYCSVSTFCHQWRKEKHE